MRGLQSHYLANDWFADDCIASKSMDSDIKSRVAGADHNWGPYLKDSGQEQGEVDKLPILLP